MSRWALAVVLVAAVGSGCQCTPQEDCSDVSVRFDAPVDGATVTAPFDVDIRATNSAGVAYKFDSATLTNGSFTAEGTVADGTAKFAGVQVDPGAATLTASIQRGACVKTASIDVTVRSETCASPAVTAVSFPQDANNDGLLNAAELPVGTSLQVRVAAECVAGVQVQIKRGSTVVGGPESFSNGAVTVTVPSLADANSATYDLVAELVQNGAPVGSSLGGSVRVERAPPACQNTTELIQGPKNGGMGAQHQLLASGNTSAALAEFRLDGAQAMPSTPSMGQVSASWSVPKSGEATYAVELKCLDNFGNTSTDTKMVRVDYVAPTAMITRPVTNPDGGATVLSDSPTSVQVMTNAEDGAQACAFRVRGMMRTMTGCAAVSSGVATLAVPFALDGAYTIEVEVTDLAGNQTTASVAVDVVLSGCGLGFTRPAACPALITAAQATGGAYAFQTQSNASCAGQTVRLAMQAVAADGGLGPTMTVGTGAVGGGGLATISSPVTNGTYVYSAEVSNLGADAGLSTVSCDVTVDLDGPAIQSPVVPSGQTVATISAAQDTQPTTCGAQRTLQFSASVPTGGRVDVCTTQATDPCTMLARAPSAACGTGWYLLQSNVTSPASGFTFSEGTYSIKVVVVANGTTNESQPLPLLVDVTRPCVVKAMVPWPQDTAGGMADGKLNITELGSGAPRLQFALGCGDVDGSTLAATSPVVVREVVSGTPAGVFNLDADALFSMGAVTVDLTQGVANEKDYAFFVELTDRAGNTNLYTGAMDPARHDVRVDKVAPTCDITSPSAMTTLLGQAGVPGGMLSVTVTSSADVLTNGVTVTLAGPTSTTRQVTPSGPANQAQTSFAVTGTNAWTVSSTCTDTALNATTATNRALTIDLDAPTCSIVSPASGAVSMVNDIQTTVNVTGGEGRQVSCSTNGTPLTPQLLVSSGVATHLLSYPNGSQTVACSLTDAAGNAGSCQSTNVVVNSMSCGLTITSTQTTASGFWHNRSNTGSLTATTGAATVTANTADCGAGKTVTLQRMSPTTGAATTALTDASGNVSFPGVNVADGERWEVRIDNGTGLTTTRSFRVGLVAPAATGVTIGGTAVTTGSNLFFVAATGNRNVETGVAGYFADTSADTVAAGAQAQFNLAVNGVSGAFKAGLNGTVELLFKGSPIASQNVTSDPQSFSFTGASLPHNDSGTFAVRLTDTAGNTSTVISNPAAIDVVAPGTPPVVMQSVASARAAQVNLQWQPVYDDDSPGSLAHAGYDVRWTTSSVSGNNAMASTAEFFSSAVSYPENTGSSRVPWSAATITRVFDVPPMNTYYFSVRAVDEVGNYSPFVAPVGIPNVAAPITLTVASAVADFGQTVLASSNVLGTAFNDIVISAPSRGSVGSVYVFVGGPGLASQTTCAAGACQELTPPDAVGAFFGSDVSTAGNVADDAADATTTGMADVVVGQRGFGTTGRVFVFLGSSGASITKSIEIRGDAASTIGWTAQTVRDLDGDGLDELALPAHLYGGGRGRIYLFKGRSLAAWQALFVMGQQYLSINSADWVIEGEYLYAATPANSATTGNGFGVNRNGLVVLPGVTGRTQPDGGTYREVAISVPRANVSRVAIYGADQIVGSSPAAPLGAFDAGIQVISQAPTGSNSSVTGFGAAVWAPGPVQRLDLADMYVGYPAQNRVYRYSNWSSSGVQMGAATEYIDGPALSNFGAHIVSGDLNGDGRADLVVGEATASNNGVWTLYQRSTGAFDSPLGGSSTRFSWSLIRPVRAGGAVNQMVSRIIAVGDIGDGTPALLISDSTSGRVQVWK